MEVCVDSLISAQNAEKGGAIRIELCADLGGGGTTPSIGLLQTVKEILHIPVFVMIRPRLGDFFYSKEEIKVMESDIKAVKSYGADGIVIGALTREGNVDKDLMQKFIELAAPLPVTFHRAFDVAADPMEALQVLLELGCARLLTSGQQQTAEEGLPLIINLIEAVAKSGKQMIIMPGSGINEGNLSVILQRSKAKEYHASARSLVKSSMRFQKQFMIMGSSKDDLYQWQICDEQKVHRMVEIAKGVWQHQA